MFDDLIKQVFTWSQLVKVYLSNASQLQAIAMAIKCSPPFKVGGSNGYRAVGRPNGPKLLAREVYVTSIPAPPRTWGVTIC